VLTAIVGLPILLYTVWSQIPYFFAALAAIAGLIALSEFYALASRVDCKPQVFLGYASGLVVLASFVVGKPSLSVASLVALSIVSLAIAFFSSDEMKGSIANVSATMFGVVYVALLTGCLI